MTLTYVSLFSGIEAFSVAASRIRDVDWRPVFFSEIEPFPCAVLAHHFPTVPNLGDICKIRIDHADNTVSNDDTTIPLPRTGIDILAGGSPCQDVSVAGRRAGMSEGSGTRSSLAFEYVRLVRDLHPRVFLWENVPGIFSSNGGRDFAAFLHSLDELGYSLAWRVLDCQYTRVDSAPRAVPQRRRRVWLVGCLGGDGRVPAQILFERAGLLGDTPPRREAGKGFAAPAEYGPARNDRVVGAAGRRPGIAADPHAEGTASGEEGGTGAGADRGGRGNDAGEGAGTGTYGGDIAETLDASYYKGQGARDGRERAPVISTPPSSSASFDGLDCAPTLHRPNGAPGYSDQEVFAQQGSYLARVATFENHGQDSRIRPIDVSDTRSGKDGTGGNNLPLVVFAKASHARNAAGDGERYAESDVAQTRNTFDNGDFRAQEVVVGFSHTASGAMLDCRPAPVSVPCKSSPGGENAVVIGFMSAPSANAGGICAQKEVAPCINTVEVKCVALCADTYNQTATEEACMPLRSAMTGTERNDADPKVVAGVFNMGGNKASAGVDCSGATPSLLSGHGTDPHAVAVGFKGGQSAAGGLGVEVENAPTLPHQPKGQAVKTGAIVRRLTPCECETLQFFPQDWTRIPYRGKPADRCPDSPRYKALGNSWATNCAEWILRRIVAAFRLGIIN